MEWIPMAISPFRKSGCAMRIIGALSLCLALSTAIQAQLLVMDFDVDSSQTVIGPSPTSISSSAGTLPGGTSGRGLAAKRNASLDKLDIEMDFPNTDGYWDVSGLDVSLDFNRQEDNASFFKRMNNAFDFGMTSGYVSVTYEVSDGSGGSMTVSSGNIQEIPSNGSWNRFRFTYDPNNGVGSVYINDTLVWYLDGPNGRRMYWDGADQMRIGHMLDAFGYAVPTIDSVAISAINVLPIELMCFSAESFESGVLLSWSTATEVNNDHFDILRTQETKTWELIGSVPGVGTSAIRQDYEWLDPLPGSETVYYRLEQVDHDGTRTLSEIVSIAPPTKSGPSSSFIFPNPTNGRCHVIHPFADAQITVYSNRGEQLSVLSGNDIDLTESRAGTYVVRIDAGSEVEVLQLVKH